MFVALLNLINVLVTAAAVVTSRKVCLKETTEPWPVTLGNCGFPLDDAGT